jgi:hypothetical protein
MSETCPYCGAQLDDVAYLGRHAMTEHREAVRAHLVGEGYISPFHTGQQTLGQVVA